MLLEEMLRDEKREGIKEGIKTGSLDTKRDSILTICQSYGDVPDSLSSALFGIGDLDVLEKVFRFALAHKSLDEIEKFIRTL